MAVTCASVQSGEANGAKALRPPGEWAAPVERDEETCTTDAGSESGSEAESISSLASTGERCERKLALGVERPLRLRKKAQFKGSLETIPGTPIAADRIAADEPKQTQIYFPPGLHSHDDESRPVAAKKDTTVTSFAVSRFGTAPAPSTNSAAQASSQRTPGVHANVKKCGSFGTVPIAANASKTQPRQGSLAKAKLKGLPLKVQLPEHLAPVAFRRGIDVTQPMKKKPVFEKIFGDEAQEALHSLELSMPVKKRLSQYFYEDVCSSGVCDILQRKMPSTRSATMLRACPR